MKPSERLSLLASALIVLAATWTSVLDLGFIWDDDDYVVRNPLLDDAAGLRRIWFEPGATPQYYPLVFTSFAAERALFGDGARAHHVTNVALHLLSAFMLWTVLTRLRIPGGWFAAALFLVHPVAVESVAWITERKNVLSLAFALAATLAWLTFDERGVARRRAYALMVGLFVCALLSKTVTSVLPIVFLLLAWARRGTISRRDVRPVLPLVLLSLCAGFVTASVEQRHVFKDVFTLGLQPLDRVLLAGRALWFYLSQLTLPRDIVFCYPRFVIDSNDTIAYLYPAGFVAVTILLFLLRHRVGRWPVVALLAYAALLAPALGFVDVYPMIYSFVADHFQYHASAAFLALLAACACRITRGLQSVARGALAAAVLGALAWQTHGLIGDYQDEETLWRATMARNPDAIMAPNNLALIEHERGDDAAALQLVTQAAEIEPVRAHPFVLALTYYNVGWSLIENDRAGEARGWFERSIATHPSYLDAYSMLARRMLADGQREEAIATLERALAIRPDYVEARRILESVHHHR